MTDSLPEILLTHPYCWPHVRRGTERNMDGLGTWLHERGYTVTTLSSHAGAYCEEHTQAGRRVLYPQRWHPLLGKVRIQPLHSFLLSAWQGIRAENPDIVHSFHFNDALVAQSLARRQGYRHLFQINGTPLPGAFRRFLPPDRSIVRRSIMGTELMLTCSGFCRDLIHECYGVESEVIVPPVDVERFQPGPGPADGEPPVLLAVGDLNQPNKGLRVLLEAFVLLRQRGSNARLQLSGRLSEENQASAFAAIPQALRADIEVLGLGKPEDLPQQYAGASLLVLPSVWEASGSVMFEAWSAGTPVVASRHAGLPEFVNQDVGVLFEPEMEGLAATNAGGLAAAIEAGLELGSDPATRARCREHALRYSWASVGPQYAELYSRLLQ